MDWKNPDYGAIFKERFDRMERIRSAPDYEDTIRWMKAFYRINPATFISDWGITFDPRNADIGLPTLIPFVLFPKQIEWINKVIEKWRSRRPLITEKSRDCGISYCAVALACTLCLFETGIAIGFGSRKEDYVDKIGQPKSLFWKARLFMQHVPDEFRGGWEAWRDAPHMRINFPESGSVITGEAGDNIGRGDRTTIHFIDESAYLERPELVDAALSQTTNCRIDVSSVNGMNNSFAKKRHEGKIEVFVFDWRHDPRKDQEWYDRQCEDLDPVVVAQEIDRDYLASAHGLVIPGQWARALLDAHIKLGISRTGHKRAALDVADEGVDKNAIGVMDGVIVEHLREWSGKGSDPFETTSKTFEALDDIQDIDSIRYDADGIGASIRGDARVINEQRAAVGARTYHFQGWRGSGKVIDPEGAVEGTVGGEGDRGRLNQDYFQNAKAQGWWALRNRARKTFRWVVQGYPCKEEEVLSLDTQALGGLAHKAVTELSQVVYTRNLAGKIVVDKKPAASAPKLKSPNLGDVIMMMNAPGESFVEVPVEMMQQLRASVMSATAAKRQHATVTRARRYR